MFLMKEHVGKLIADLKGLIYRDIRPIETYRYKKAGSALWSLFGLTKKVSETRESCVISHRKVFRTVLMIC